MPHPPAKIQRKFELVEPIATVTFSTGPDEAFRALGMHNYWDGYFAGRAAPLGMAPAAPNPRDVPRHLAVGEVVEDRVHHQEPTTHVLGPVSVAPRIVTSRGQDRQTPPRPTGP